MRLVNALHYKQNRSQFICNNYRMSSALSDVLVAGGGISGITTAISLQSLGLRVCILASEFPLKQPEPTISDEIATCWRCYRSSRVASTYAMASAYPHNLRVANLERISADSQSAFARLHLQNAPGIYRYKMFEVFEHCPQPAPLASQRLAFQQFDGSPEELRRTIDPPSRPGAHYLWGWSFETYFADMPVYVPYLWALFEERGGTWRMCDLSLDMILKSARGRPVIDCLGLSAPSVFVDPAPCVVMRGRQVVVPGAPVIKGEDGLPVAYNYTPTANVFCREDGSPEYVHFFPRSDGWILGQTREPGRVDERGRWHGDAVKAEEVSIGGQSVPLPIISLNNELLDSWKGKDTSGKRLIGREGYRYYRDPQEAGVRLEFEEIDGTPVIHNYGHGGSGITMSWGCAQEVVRIFNRNCPVGLTKRFDTDEEPLNAVFETSVRRDCPRDQLPPAGQACNDWSDASIDQLIDHILTTHHEFLNRALPALSELADKAWQEAGSKRTELAVIRETLHDLRAELEEHAQKEELVLFPACRKLAASGKQQTFHCGGIENPLSVLESEHVDALSALKRVREMSNGYENARCDWYNALMQHVFDLEEDLKKHIFEEDMVLFAKIRQRSASDEL